jgi:reductive dehalogenase
MTSTLQKSTISIDYDICDSSKCEYECLDVCHISKNNEINPAIFSKEGKPVIRLDACTLCGRCERNCPLGAITSSSEAQHIESISQYSITKLENWEEEPYVVDHSIFQPFNQENTIFARVGNDPSYDLYRKGIYANHQEIFGLKKPGYSKIDAAVAMSAWAVHDQFSGAFSWGKLEALPDMKFDADFQENVIDKIEVNDIEEMSRIIKQVARSFGAATVGICELKRDWLYTHDRKGKAIEIPDNINNAIVIAVEMDLETLQTSPAYPSAFATGNGYSRMAFIQACLADFIRNLGYDAIPAGNGVGLSVPMAIDAGLGQYGRHGLLITPKFGSNVRLCKVFTNLPMQHDKPISLGALSFCKTCMRCAESCPSQSISYSQEPSWMGPTVSNNPGTYKWYVNVETCYGFWVENGNDCSNCITSCPFTKNRHWSHSVARWFIKHFPFLNRMWVRLDHLMGYGKQRDPDIYWEEDKEFIHSR